MADTSSSKPNSPLPPPHKTSSNAEKASNHDELEAWQRRRSGKVLVLEGYVSGGDGGGEGAGVTKSLTEEDLEDLNGCVDLGFGNKYDSIPELIPTLPALELCYSLSQQYENEQIKGSLKAPQPPETATRPINDWKISGPGEDPEKVKARLKYWAQAVACTVRLCD